MRAPRQSTLSLASSLFYAAGGVLALASNVLQPQNSTALVVTNLVVGFACFGVTAAIFAAGRRFPGGIGIALLCLSATVVLCLVLIIPTLLRAQTTGTLFYTFIMYLFWFGSASLARLFGWAWLCGYSVILLLRFGSESVPVLVSLTITSMLLGELVGFAKRRLEARSLTDDLTGLWNRRGMRMELSRSVRATERSNDPLSVVFMDLDNLKRVNDTRGHGAGDEMIRSFSGQVQSAIRAQDSLARIGGDEFVLLLPNTGIDQAHGTVLRLRQQIDAEWSYGAAQLQPGEAMDPFLARAEARMREEKLDRKHR